MGHNGTNADGNFLLTYDMKKAREILHGIIYNGDEIPESVKSNSYAEQAYGVQKKDDKPTEAPSEDSAPSETPEPTSLPSDPGQGSGGGSDQPALPPEGDSSNGEG